MDASVAAMRAPRRGKAALNRLIQNRQVTSSGVKWLEVALDPFHDTEVVSDGYPDVTTTRSITQVVTKTMTVVAPAGLTTATWDAHFFFNPCTTPWTQFATTTTTTTATTKTTKPEEKCPGKRKRVEEEESLSIEPDEPESVATNLFYRTTVDSGGTINQTGSGLTLCAGWNCITTNNGEGWTVATIGEENDDGQFPPQFASGAFRLIATGCEVVNTTAELYKGGSVTNYRSPSPAQQCTMRTTGTPAYWTAPRMGLLPPDNVADAALYPNSKTWGASDGTYMIATLNESENTFFNPVPGCAGLLTPISFDGLAGGEGWLAWMPSATLNTLNSASNGILPWDIAGCIFSGLNAQSSLQVTTRYYIERHPTIADPNLLVLARTPCPYDPTALEIYARAMGELPVAVPVGENPLGEWFTEVLDVIGEWAPKIGGFLSGAGVPFAGGIGNVIGAGAKSINGMSAKKVIKREVKKDVKKEVRQRIKRKAPLPQQARRPRRPRGPKPPSRRGKNHDGIL